MEHVKVDEPDDGHTGHNRINKKIECGQFKIVIRNSIYIQKLHQNSFMHMGKQYFF